VDSGIAGVPLREVSLYILEWIPVKRETYLYLSILKINKYLLSQVIIQTLM